MSRGRQRILGPSCQGHCFGPLTCEFIAAVAAYRGQKGDGCCLGALSDWLWRQCFHRFGRTDPVRAP